MPPVATDIQLGLAAKDAGWNTQRDIQIAIAVSLAESGGDITVTHRNRNGSVDYGAWQVNSIHGFPVSQLTTLDGNAKAAHQVFTQQGWPAWSTFKSGAYFPFMLRASTAAAIAMNAPAGSAGGGRADTNIDLPGSDQLSAVVDFVKFVTDPKEWQRLGLFLLGAMFIIVGLFKLTGNNQLSSTTKSLIKTAAVIK